MLAQRSIFNGRYVIFICHATGKIACVEPVILTFNATLFAVPTTVIMETIPCTVTDLCIGIAYRLLQWFFFFREPIHSAYH